MNDEDKKMIEEAQRLDKEATPGPWYVFDGGYPAAGLTVADGAFVGGARTLLPKLAARLREVLEANEQGLETFEELRSAYDGLREVLDETMKERDEWRATYHNLARAFVERDAEARAFEKERNEDRLRVEELREALEYEHRELEQAKRHRRYLEADIDDTEGQ